MQEALKLLCLYPGSTLDLSWISLDKPLPCAFEFKSFAKGPSHLLTRTSPSLVAVVRGDSKVAGTVTFEQASETAPTTISWDITGYDPNAKRGMHIHTFGDNTNGCTSAGPHCMCHGL